MNFKLNSQWTKTLVGKIIKKSIFKKFQKEFIIDIMDMNCNINDVYAEGTITVNFKIRKEDFASIILKNI